MAVAVAALGLAAPASAGGGFELTHTVVSPKSALFDAAPTVKLRYRFRAPAERDLEIRVLRKQSGDTVAVFRRRAAPPATLLRRPWNGLNRRGRPAPDGRYEFRVGVRGGRSFFAGRFSLHGYTYPVDGPHGPRGALGSYGAPRTGGRRHEGYDILADCGTRLVAARGGRVTRAAYDRELHGWHVRIAARRSSRDLLYSHLASRPRFERGDRVHTGALLGHVGQTGNADGTPCHLHFEVRENKRHTDPEPLLRRWDRWS